MPPGFDQSLPVRNETKSKTSACSMFTTGYLTCPFQGSASGRDVAGNRADPAPPGREEDAPARPRHPPPAGAERPGCAPQKPGPGPAPGRHRRRDPPSPPQTGVTPGRPQLPPGLRGAVPPPRVPRTHPPAPFLGPAAGPAGVPAPARSAGPGAPRQDGAGRRRGRTDAPAPAAEPGRAETALPASLGARHGRPGGAAGAGAAARCLPVPPSLPRPCGGHAAARGRPPPGERQRLAGRGEPPVRCSGWVQGGGCPVPGGDKPGSSAHSTSQVNAGPGPGRGEKRVSCLLSLALRRGPGATTGHRAELRQGSCGPWSLKLTLRHHRAALLQAPSHLPPSVLTQAGAAQLAPEQSTASAFNIDPWQSTYRFHKDGSLLARIFMVIQHSCFQIKDC